LEISLDQLKKGVKEKAEETKSALLLIM